MVSRRFGIVVPLASALAATTACELPQQPVPPPDPVLVVHAVLNTASDTQFVVVEGSNTGDTASIYNFGLVPAVPAMRPVWGAEVILEHLTPPAGCVSAIVRLSEQTLVDNRGDSVSRTGVYATDALCALRPGDRIGLIVRGLGHEVTGETTMPRVGSVAVGLLPRTQGGDTLLVQRERDSVWIALGDMSGAAVQYEVFRANQKTLRYPVDYPYSFVSDTAGAVIPGNLVLPFEGDDGVDLLQPGRYYVLTVAATDRNYFDFARSEGDLFTGRGFINHLDGGIGVFGSVDPATRILKIVAERRTPEEGRYRITGALTDGPVDATLELYRTQRVGPIEPFSAFLAGTWGGRPLSIGMADGALGEAWRGVFPHSFTAEIVAGTPPDTVRYFVGGTRGVIGVPFELLVQRASVAGEPPESLSAIQESTGQ